MSAGPRLAFGHSWVLGLWFALGATIPLAVAGDGPRPTHGRADLAQEEFFEARVRPILVMHCQECHGPEKQKGGLRLDERNAMLRGGEAGRVVVPGKPEESLLIEAIRHEGDVQMPPKRKLKDEDVTALTEWVKRGAVWPETRQSARTRGATSGTTATANAVRPGNSLKELDRGLWSLQPVRDLTPPAVREGEWSRSPIDRFILAELEKNGLEPAPPADKATLIRRASFDLTGLPPEPDQIDAFLRDDAPDAFDKLVERLLASPHYGERWGRYWLDVARYGEDQAHTFQPRLYPGGYRFRDWLVRALNRDMPYDRFVLEQIAGDLIEGPERLDRMAALGFFACGPVYYGDAKKLDQYADRIDTLTRGFLGLTVACARCHDHKYDPIPTSDYYALAGVFASTQYVEIPAVPQNQVDAYNKAQAAIPSQAKVIAAFLRAEAEKLKQKATTDQLKKVERLLPAEPRKKLAGLKAELEVLKKTAPAKYPVIHALAEAPSPTEMPVLVRGNPDTPGAKVPRRFLTVLGGDRTSFHHGSGRLELARAIACADNPLTARVLVNRIWQHHFGRGLVATASNFGSLGERPSHPELLDWLARRFVTAGWSQKTLHREIMLSAVYQQSSRFDSDGFARDPGNTLLWRMNRRRLDVEAWRDAMLAVAGRLDPALGGPSVDLEAAGNARRTVYAAISRHDPAWMLRLFDFPDPNISSDSRAFTTVPLQQLFVLNSEF
ncbi:MAG TPA: PSD1 and planctomycete cytochrome C domain-containing protein, partial [Isosphaeraceae bacterium]|nr:PSD1 and planctomycete cytochrome C domain-containing protein [Isosphaeraceae bacterium]